MNGSMKLLRVPLLCLGTLLSAGAALAQLALPIEFRHVSQGETKLNAQWRAGPPTATGNESTGVHVDPTRGQFRSLMPLGAIPGLKRSDWEAVRTSAILNNGTTPFSGAVAQEMRLPRATVDGTVVMVLRRGHIGAPFLSRQVSFAFGSIVAAPEKDERGVLLGSTPNSAYWLPEPHTTNTHSGVGYYWSPHARQVYAIQPGPLAVTWRKAQPYTLANRPTYTNPNGPVSWETNGANIFLLYTENYIVSGSAAKPPRKMYWTQKGFQNIGVSVRVPTARVGAVNIVYNNNFPRTVTTEYTGVGSSSPSDGTGNQPLEELRTLWYDQQLGSIYAYNAEGRVFVELLGDLRPDGQTYQPLGTEIVDVTKQPQPADVAIELGERILPPEGGAVDELFPQAVQQGVGSEFAYQHSVASVLRPELYAIKETFNLNDYLVHWLEEGEAALKWPKLFGRYRLVWPTDLAKYSHYVRPPAATDAEAAQTAVLMDPENAPTIEYQDALDRPRARFTPELKFYTWLNESYPSHRTLLRYVSGENIGFERVLSTLNTALIDVVNLPGASIDEPVGLRQAGANSVLSLGGENGTYGQLPAGTYFAPGGFTVEAWVFVREVRNWSRLIDFGNGPASDNVVFALSQGTSGRPRLEFYRGASTTGLTANSVLPLQQWVHLAATFDGTTARIYLNGQLDAQGPLQGATQVVTRNNAYVGRSNWGGDAPPNADYDNLRIWSRGLSATEIVGSMQTEYPAGTAGLRAQFTFERLENPATDSSGSGSHLTLFGGAATGVPGLNRLTAPRYIARTVPVGERINAPAGERGDTGGAAYLAGYIVQSQGTSYNPGTYRDPFVVGFAEANLGAIIPVNVLPGRNQLEIWWFRPNQSRAGLNAGNTVLGFSTVYWPSVVGEYTIQWPGNAREIVLASKLGGQGLSTSEALGTIYTQNDPAMPGYNPNEEHAIMSGGTPFATRDDLNLLAPADQYSSHPFVLVDYPHPDGRPAMAVFQVLREKPSAGWVFDYLVPAGQLIQPPPPLNFLAKPVEGSGDLAVNYNTEPAGGDGDLPGGWNAAAADGQYGHYQRFTYRDRKHELWVYRGPHAGLPELKAGTYNPAADTFGALGSASAVVGAPFSFTVHVSRQTEYLEMTVAGAPNWLTLDGFTLRGTPQGGDVGTRNIAVTVRDLYDQTTVTGQLSVQVAASGLTSGQAPLLLRSTNQYTGTIVEFTDRAPFLARSPAPSNSFTLRYYYKTEPSFAWPGIAAPPAPGSIVPYLRPWDEAAQEFVGDPDSKQTRSLDIVYRPFWPERDPKDSSKPVPILPYGATLVEPFPGGFPGVRDFKTAHILYQQSIAEDLATAAASAVLHDPTRAKYVDISTQFADQIPAGVKIEYYQGKIFFPLLPPHLVDRVFIDPNIGPKGSLGLIGEYKQELLGESYLQLNVLRGSDLAAVHALCPTGDTANYPKWVALVNALATPVETFREDVPLRPGTYVANPDQTVSVGVGELAVIENDNTAVDSYALSATGPGSGYLTLLEASGTAFTQPGDPVALHVFRVGGGLHRGELKIIPAPNPLSELITFQHTPDLAGRFDEYEYEWKIAAPVDGFPPEPDATMSRYLSLTAVAADIPRYTLGGVGIQALGDNYVVMRYRPLSPAHPLYRANPTDADWSEWTRPALAEGWIKRVLAGINPFNQRINDLFNNRVNTDVSILTQAGRKWEGDVALNIDTINNYGLIEIYETVLRRGRSLSIESGFNYGPANDALLLAAGYLNDLYMMIGNEAWADAANPTIGIGTADNTYGDIATALFAFRGQMPSLLEEELALLRGRDDFFQPGVEITPVYNRLIWNYTRGIDAGEVIYALNYNIQENPDQSPDGIINAEDAARMFPQGHGDGYGHYLTAIKGYYSLLLNQFFDWVPRIEAVNVLGQPVSVDYQDERKFAAAAAALARAGRQIFDLNWRKDYAPTREQGWAHFSPTRVNSRRSYETSDGPKNPERFWGMDHWASRVGQGTYLNWVVGNAILPYADPIPTHEGIQKVDRTTVPELRELATIGAGLQTALDNAEGGQSPLGIPEGGLAFDINPYAVVGMENGTHFEQVFKRAKSTLQNAVAAFDDAKDVTRLMRSEQDSLAELQNTVARQEQAYTVALIDLYGTPYPDDIGPGKLYRQGYNGPDLIHYKYVDLPEANIPEIWSYSNTTEWSIPLRNLPTNWVAGTYVSTNSGTIITNSFPAQHYEYINFPEVETLTFNIGPHGFAEKPANWTSRRYSPGKIQQAISEQILAHMRLRQTINDTAGDLVVFQKTIDVFEADNATFKTIRDIQTGLLVADEVLEKTKFAFDLYDKYNESIKKDIVDGAGLIAHGFPDSFIAGLAAGGDLTSAGEAAVLAAGLQVTSVLDKVALAKYTVFSAWELATTTARKYAEFFGIAPMERAKELRNAVQDIGNKLGDMQGRLWTINERVREYDDKQRAVRALIAQGDTIQAEREIFRQRAAAVVHGYRTRDAAFRIFRNEKLERYKTLFDLAARYALLAANAYDYETGLLNTSAGREFKRRIINARALGVVREGEPQFAGSNTGDPGLSSALAEMKADWDVLRGRLGFNSPDAYTTTVSLRTEQLRLLPGTDGDISWQDVLHRARVDNILADGDVRRFCLQVDAGDGLPVPGIILTFSTTIADGLNLFGQPLAAGDSTFSPSSFATKIFAAGAALEGYRGMGTPSANDGAVSGAGGASVEDPPVWFLDPNALAATPYIYLVPVGVDSLRTPPLGDATGIRTWNVEDLAIPLPFNIGASGFSEGGLFQSGDTLTEPLFARRKHQAFRPVPSPDYFNTDIYYGGDLLRSQYTNNRLIGRSVWNSQWKLVIPGRTLLNNPQEGLDRFIRTVKDIKLHFVTYSYSGN
jgi:hypothetical protein